MLDKYVWNSSGFSYFCSNSVKLDELDELEKKQTMIMLRLCRDSFGNFSYMYSISDFEFIDNLNNTIPAKCTDYSTIHAKFFDYKT